MLPMVTGAWALISTPGELVYGLYVVAHRGLGLEAQALQVVQARLDGCRQGVFSGTVGQPLRAPYLGRPQRGAPCGVNGRSRDSKVHRERLGAVGADWYGRQAQFRDFLGNFRLLGDG